MAALTTFSEISGYASIACWLGAQFPQVMKNIQMQSSDGLALPFLANWLAGDVSNLIGCILTHQLPFQTWLAMYFCCVDMALLGQYIYYRSRKPSAPIYSHARIRTTSITGRRVSVERHIPHYRSLSTVAANVAAGAALAAQQEGQDTRHSRTRWQSNSADRFGEASGSHIPKETTDHEDEDEDDAALADSIHSEGGWSSKQKRVSWNSERFGRSGSVGRGRMGRTSPMHSSLQITSSHHRGRALQREGEPSTEEEPEEWNRSRTISAHRASSRASRRGASMVFLGVWALFGIGTLAGNRHGFPPASVANIGKVLTGNSISMTHVATAPAAATYSALSSESSPLPVVLDDNRGGDLPTDRASQERVLGRIFAWLCTTLYLTSRLPQIWKNYARKSVEGLSVYLFVFAFLGNSFYVISILTSPNMRLPSPRKEAFIRESIPYLLGSGGTLLFDITIVNQSLIYRRRPSRHGGRRYSVRGRNLEEEEAALLGADTLAGQSRTSST